MLLEQIRINKYMIELVEDKEPLYRPIYSLILIKPKFFKIYIKTNLAYYFI